MLALGNSIFCYDEFKLLSPSLSRLFPVAAIALQALAAGVAMACPMESKHSSVAEIAMEDCDDATMVHAHVADSQAQANAADFRQNLPPDTPPCSWSSSCFALVAMALLSANRLLHSEPAFNRVGFTDIFYRSHIPEGLQRPPQTIPS